MNGKSVPRSFASNRVKNQKYNVVTFVPLVLYNQFKFFFNLFFLVIALTQFIPPLKVGIMFTYFFPLAFVLFVTLLKEAADDITRYRRDKELNNKGVQKLQKNRGFVQIPSAKMRVGDIIKVRQGERIPADLILLYTTDKNGTIFIKTDQLDGETDWKLRKAITLTQNTHPCEQIINLDGYIVANPPNDQIYDFMGYF